MFPCMMFAPNVCSSRILLCMILLELSLRNSAMLLELSLLRFDRDLRTSPGVTVQADLMARLSEAFNRLKEQAAASGSVVV